MNTELIGMRVNKLSMFKVGDGRFGYLQFEYRGILSKEEAAQMQMKRGYHPAGYDFFAHNVVDRTTTWRCSVTCD